MSAPAAAARLSPNALVAWTIVVGAAVRVAFAAATGYGIGESYYVASARHLALSYFDQPPLSLWVMWALHHVVDAGNALAMRLPFIAMFAVTTWLMYRLGARLFGAWAGAWAAVLLNLSFVFTISVGTWAQPDAPLFLFILAATIAVVELAFANPSRPLLWWAAAGAAFGLALLSKYHAALTLGGLLIFVATTPAYRTWFFHRGLLLAAVIATVVFAPVLIWNAEYHWASFAFQSARVEGSGVHFDWFLRSVIGQGVLIGVLLWPPMVYLLFRGLARGPRDPKVWFLCCLAIIPVVLFTAAAIWADFGLHLHWQSTGYVFLFPFLGKAVADRMQRGDRLTRTWLAASAVLLLATVAVVGSDAQLGWLEKVLPQGMKAWALSPDNPASELQGWTGVRDRLVTLGMVPRDHLFAVVPEWTEAGKLDVEIGDDLPAVCLCGDPRNIAFARDASTFAGDDALIFTLDPNGNIPRSYAHYFADVAPLTTVEVRRGGAVALTVYVFLAHGYRANYSLPYP